MAKQSVQDVTPPEKRSIRNIPVSSTRRVFSRANSTDDEEESVRERPSRTTAPRDTSRIVLWGIAFVSLVVLIMGVSAIFTSTTFEIIPQTEFVTIDQDITAYREAHGTTPSLLYTVMTVNREATRSVDATGEEMVSKTASGKIVIYNNYSTVSQRLIKNTRFETADGLIFRIRDPLTIPGAKKVSGELVPGSVEAVVYADQPGEKYNIGLSDFTIPGFKGDPRYTTFYARSKSPFSGGYVGVVKKVDPVVRAETIQELKDKLTKEIEAEALAEKPEGFVLYDKARFVTFTELTDTTVDGKAVIGLQATLSGIILDERQLAQAIATSIVRGYNDEPVYSPDISKLNFFLNRDKVKLDTDKELTFHLSGQTRIVYAVDDDVFVASVLGKELSALPEVLKQYPFIVNVKPIPRPFWARTIPVEADQIHIKINIPETQLP